MALTAEEYAQLASLAVEHTSDGFLCCDPDGAILCANDAASRVLGQPARALADLSIFQIAPDLNPALWRELWKEIRSRQSFAFEFALRASEERLVSVEMVVHHLRTGTREFACAFFRDVEERKRLKTLQEEFVSTVSHEMRTPMTVIREGVSQVLEGLRGQINERQHRALTLVLDGIDRLGRMINELLDISKMESGKASLRRERLDFGALAREVAATFQPLAAERQIDLVVAAPDQPTLLYADRDRLIQVLTNLISNAFKFTEQGKIELSVSAQDGEAICRVSDTGVGLAPEDVEKIFNKFEQLEQASVTGEKGTGLGLAISRAIVDLHQGRIWAESAGSGKGTTVAFALPKQSGRELFRDQVAGLLEEIARRGGTLSTAVLRLQPSGGVVPSEHEALCALENLENHVRQTGRTTDLIVKDEGVIYLALPSTVKREAVRVLDRMIGSFESSREPYGASSSWRASYRLTSFPEDAPEEPAFLAALLKEAL